MNDMNYNNHTLIDDDYKTKVKDFIDNPRYGDKELNKLTNKIATLKDDKVALTKLLGFLYIPIIGGNFPDNIDFLKTDMKISLTKDEALLLAYSLITEYEEDLNNGDRTIWFPESQSIECLNYITVEDIDGDIEGDMIDISGVYRALLHYIMGEEEF